ncbi:hypothetical protein [Candidatus Villigracilis affinis]|nr:hypothetical protein [Anaerolineales bacterium]
MPPKYKKQRSHTPAWLDTLIVWLELIGFIGVILSGIYTLFTWISS